MADGWLGAVQAEAMVFGQDAEDTLYADGLRELSSDEAEVTPETQGRLWYWLKPLKAHMHDYKMVPQSKPLRLLSSCTGAFSEGEVLEASQSKKAESNSNSWAHKFQP